ncbi:efflux RND transporter periplasmic adaptor subunit [Sulfuricurvum sp. IAE1]|jgi:membrane fusion protein (multidrug efflux system)|uniref:efflux RND transporter periplasmic adaptor subunit n=1 Tax=Sulfuricurvum sp. IAE1 TaxID=2546102 RepID=UPI0010517BF4|nr:efflux RND transporter periplasmic adaptor subunit [Sulfuricurvum sp. IAE1]MDD3770047.1 efflux RND transporter periplasmic adaptor subunit [Sulfuricurvum sp.]MDX9965690.1 efflux RND transporter periplasmic adaptor subunit [Sulfuricurvum sp.]TDA69155.1 efflux RND transporter periplasmic adaptor subunit [Sulfuricurvum sp. IAE1]
MKRLTLMTLSLAAVLAISGCERPKAAGMQPPPQGPVPVTTTQVKTGNFPAVLEATGKTEAYNTVQIYARVNGYLAKRHYDEGAYVAKGTTLFTIDPSDLKNALDSAKASYDLAVANHTNAKAVLNRIKPLAEANAASRQELDTATANERNTAAAVAAAKASLEQARLNLSYTTVKAPISGFVDKRKVDVGTYVAAGANGLLTTMYQNDPIYVNFTFSENQKIAHQNAIASGKLIPPQDGKYQIELVLADGSTLSRTGTIDFVAPFVDSTTGSILYRAVVDNGDHKLLPGQFVKVKVKGMEWKDAHYLPQKTVLTGEKGKFVYVVEANNTVSPRPVTVGAWIGENIVIQGGLRGNEKIAADALPKLKPGAEVIPNGK